MSTNDVCAKIKAAESKTKQRLSLDELAKIVADAGSYTDRINIVEIYDCWRLKDFCRLVNPPSLYRDVRLFFDTASIDTAKSTTTKYSWNISNTPQSTTGVIYTEQELKNVLAMQILPFASTFSTPVQSSVITVLSANALVNYSYTIYIEEFNQDVIRGKDGRHYHFVLFPALMNVGYTANGYIAKVPSSPYLELVSTGRGNGWFWFAKPTTTSSVTINFGCPWDLVPVANMSRMVIPIRFICEK